MWDDVFGEPEGVRSTDCAWSCSYKCFHSTRYVKIVSSSVRLTDNFSPFLRSCCYLTLTTLFAPCLAFCSAINFACLAFNVSFSTNSFGPGGLRAPPEVALQCVADHCWPRRLECAMCACVRHA